MAAQYGKQKPAERGVLFGAAAIAFAVLLIVTFSWTGHDKEAARNDARTGTTTETSPKNPAPQPGGGAKQNGGYRR